MKLNYLIQGNTCVIQNGITRIGKRETKQIKEEFSELILPKSLQSIGESAFEYKILLKSVHLPEGLKEIGANAFAFCDELKEVTIPGTVTSIGKNAFANCYQLSKITIGHGVKRIGEFAFYGCHYLTKVDIPCSVTAYNDGAFCKTDIKDISLFADPSGYERLVNAFDKGVFGGEGPGLIEKLRFYSKEIGDTKDLKWKFWSLITLHVPNGMVNAYKNHPFFGEFKSIIL